MKKSEALEGSLKVGDCLQFDLESETLKLFRMDQSGVVSRRLTQDGDDKIIIPSHCNKGTAKRIATMILFASGVNGDLEDVSAEFANQPDTLITFRIITTSR